MECLDIVQKKKEDERDLLSRQFLDGKPADSVAHISTCNTLASAHRATNFVRFSPAFKSLWRASRHQIGPLSVSASNSLGGKMCRS